MPDASGVHVAATPEPLLTGAAALAGKDRKDSSQAADVEEGRRWRSRYVVITQVDGQEVALGPYLDEEAARGQLLRLEAPAKIVELYSRPDQVRGTESK